MNYYFVHFGNLPPWIFDSIESVNIADKDANIFLCTDKEIEIKNVSVPTNLNKISLGYDALNSSSYINGCIKRFTYYNSLLTENNVKTIVGNTNQIFR